MVRLRETQELNDRISGRIDRKFWGFTDLGIPLQ